ncbi:hypothetical protein EXS74_01550 [Candidatus Woesearchaeota archaeon]|nr:hypothetical protein [Candidatus Woesearchaeota archaeon]
MQIEVIDENTGNPFQYFEDDGSREVGFPRVYKKEKNVRTVCRDLNDILKISPRECLEIGPGRNLLPSEAYASQGANVSTLSLVGERRFIEEKEKRTRREDFHPRKVHTRRRIEEYLGEVGFLNEAQSELRGKQFDLVYLWGSWNNVPYCYAISKRNFDDNIIIEKERKMEEIGKAVKNGGTLLMVSECFSGFVGEENFDSLTNLKEQCIRFGLYMGSELERKARTMVIIGQTKKRTLEISNSFDDEVCTTRGDPKVMDEDPVENFLERVKRKAPGLDYSWLAKDWKDTSSAEKQAIASLGSIDAIALHF